MFRSYSLFGNSKPGESVSTGVKSTDGMHEATGALMQFPETPPLAASQGQPMSSAQARAEAQAERIHARVDQGPDFQTLLVEMQEKRRQQDEAAELEAKRRRREEDEIRQQEDQQRQEKEVAEREEEEARKKRRRQEEQHQEEEARRRRQEEQQGLDKQAKVGTDKWPTPNGRNGFGPKAHQCEQMQEAVRKRRQTTEANNNIDALTTFSALFNGS